MTQIFYRISNGFHRIWPNEDDSGNKGVGMGEFGMALIFKNVGDAVGPGDLSLNGETFEISHNMNIVQ